MLKVEEKQQKNPSPSGEGTNVSYVVTEKELKSGENEFLKDLMSPEQRLPQVTSAFQSIKCWNRISHY